MAAATVTQNTTLPQRSVFPAINATLIPIKVSYSATAYATASGGLPFDLFSFLATASPFSAPINYRDVVGFIPNGLTAEHFALDSFAIGTATSTTLPCTIRLYGTGASSQAALAEVADANLTGSFTGWVVIQRNGSN